MDFDSSFDEVASSRGNKFIALVVSDNEDEGYTTNESNVEPTIGSSNSVSKNNSVKTNKIKNINKHSLTSPSSDKFNNNNNIPNNNYHNSISTSSKLPSSSFVRSHKRHKSEEKKRWSFISNHSSSSKKRWSTLSSFTLDSNLSNSNNNNNNHHSHKANQSTTPLSKVKSSSSSKISSHSSSKKYSNKNKVMNDRTRNNSNSTISGNGNCSQGQTETKKHHSRSSSLKRSSTGSSLRLFINKIVPSAETNNGTDTLNGYHTSSEHDKENIPVVHRSHNSQDTGNNYKNKANSKTSYTPTVVVSPSSNQIRNPLKQIEINESNFRIPKISPNNGTSSHRTSTSNQLYGLNRSMENLHIQSKRASISSISSSNSLSKWKFWKKENNNTHTYETLGTNTNSTSRAKINSIPKSTSSRTLNSHLNERPVSTYSYQTSKLRSIHSISDFHNPFSHHSSNVVGNNVSLMNATNSTTKPALIKEYKTDFSFYSNTNHSNNNSNNNLKISVSLKKKPSTSSLSMSGLKNRTSQHSLKHKTSHSSLQRFKSRRKSNADDVSSFLTTNSSSNSGHSGPTSNPQISLPIPNQVSRDKIRTKLKNSTSLLSLHSNIPVSQKVYDQTVLSQLLELCSNKHVIDPTDLDSSLYQHLETLSPNHSSQLSTNVWRSTSVLDNSQTVICKKLLLSSDNNEFILKELKLLALCKGTPGFPHLLQSYVVGDGINENTVYMFLKDQGNPLTELTVTSWSQCLKIFWQCVNILYVAETKFQFEHRNMTLNHILIDKNGTITLCDMSMSRATYSKDAVIFSRLDHPQFFQGGRDYLFETYNLMRSVFLNSNEQWQDFEPRTNLIWLRYLVIMLLLRNQNNKLMGPGRDQLTNFVTLLDPYPHLQLQGKRLSHIFSKRKEADVRSSGDLLKFK